MAPDEQIITQETARQAGSSPKALGVLAAVSAGGLMAVRMKQAPLFFLAGAAVAALLARKRVIPPQRPLELMPRSVPEPATSSAPEVEAWMARQIEKEHQAPVITLEVVPAVAASADEPRIPALEAMEPGSVEKAVSEAFSFVPSWSEKPAETPASPFFDLPKDLGASFADADAERDGGGFVFPSEPEPPHAPEPLIADETPAASGASWLLDIEPLPSWDEMAEERPTSSKKNGDDFLSSPPVHSTVLESPQVPPLPDTTAPVMPDFSLFQGGALPDEITMAETATASSETPVESVMAELFMPAASPEEPLTLTVEAQEVPVDFAQPGEASFDDPLAYLEENPSALPGGIPPLPPLRPLAPVVEAEIMVRPRGFGSTTVQAKTALESAVTPLHGEAESFVTLESPFEPKSPPRHESALPGNPAAELPPAPVVLPREQKARKTWRSWWRGD